MDYFYFQVSSHEVRCPAHVTDIAKIILGK